VTYRRVEFVNLGLIPLERRRERLRGFTLLHAMSAIHKVFLQISGALMRASGEIGRSASVGGGGERARHREELTFTLLESVGLEADVSIAFLIGAR
jgi:hypothetical protein